ncbi:MAG: protein kinase [Gemmatimonadetes bacterium]|nr:protein kinase [Gemmatimonadota bacterium]
MTATSGSDRLLDPIAELRHNLRTPINHIVGYAEMLLEDAEGEEHAGRRAALAETLVAAREAIELINATLPPTRSKIEDQELADLTRSFASPQKQIRDALEGLLEDEAVMADEALVDDLSKILSAADRLGSASWGGGESGGESGGSEGSRTKGGRILVVDDSAENRDVLSRRLEREGYHPVGAANGREALDRIAEDGFDLVLLDVLMPEVDGYQVLEQLKDDPATRDIPVIMISALDDMASIVRCIERGAEDFLPKPFDPVLLRARLSACLEKKRLRDAEKEYLEQVNEVIAAASAVEAGDYQAGTLSDIARRDDELGRLARVFDGMAEHVRSREDRLRNQVDHLRDEVEAARKAQAEAADDGPGAATLSTGQRFAGRYEVLGTIGQGGMGMVYRAKDLELDEEVAIKTLRPEFVADKTVLERFKMEIRLARRISHRNVVRIHDFGESEGVDFLTMEYVEGITVRQLLDERGRLEISSTLALARQLASSLEVAHEQGVIHRDIKPQNLLVDGEGVLKVMDFGVARLAERSSGLTEVGLVVGTPAYMSPEQLLAEDIDGRSDLYAAGVVLYECLTGRLPFDAVTPVAMIAKVLTQTPEAPHAIESDVPPALSSLVMQLLARDKDERVQTATGLAAQLEGL